MRTGSAETKSLGVLSFPAISPAFMVTFLYVSVPSTVSRVPSRHIPEKFCELLRYCNNTGGFQIVFSLATP